MNEMDRFRFLLQLTFDSAIKAGIISTTMSGKEGAPPVEEKKRPARKPKAKPAPTPAAKKSVVLRKRRRTPEEMAAAKSGQASPRTSEQPS
jgi:hypothetical protein